MAKKSTIVLSARDLLARKSAKAMKRKVKDSEIDFSDIPEFTDEQLSKFKRIGRPILGESPRKPVTIRIEEEVLKKIRGKAKKRGMKYQSLINDILKKAV